jgi:hypothetical protein
MTLKFKEGEVRQIILPPVRQIILSVTYHLQNYLA